MDVKGKIAAAVGLVVLVIVLLALTPSIVALSRQAMVSTGSVWIGFEDIYDGDVSNTTGSLSYTIVHNALTGSVTDADDDLFIGQDLYPNNGDFDYEIYRAFVFFSIDPDEVLEIVMLKTGADVSNLRFLGIKDAYLRLNLTTDLSNDDFLITLQHNDTYLIPNLPLQESNYWYHNWGSNHGQYDTAALRPDDNTFNIPINALGRQWILDCVDEGEYVTWALRASTDIDAEEPIDTEMVQVESDDGIDCPPTLFILVQYEVFGHWTFTGASGAEALLGLIPFVWIAGVMLTAVVGMMAIARGRE